MQLGTIGDWDPYKAATQMWLRGPRYSIPFRKVESVAITRSEYADLYCNKEPYTTEQLPGDVPPTMNTASIKKLLSLEDADELEEDRRAVATMARLVSADGGLHAEVHGDTGNEGE